MEVKKTFRLSQNQPQDSHLFLCKFNGKPRGGTSLSKTQSGESFKINLQSVMNWPERDRDRSQPASQLPNNGTKLPRNSPFLLYANECTTLAPSWRDTHLLTLCINIMWRHIIRIRTTFKFISPLTFPAIQPPTTLPHPYQLAPAPQFREQSHPSSVEEYINFKQIRVLRGAKLFKWPNVKSGSVNKQLLCVWGRLLVECTKRGDEAFSRTK